MHFYLHAGRIPEGYRKVNRSVNRSVNKPVNRPVNRKTEAGLGDLARRKDTGRIPDHFGDLEPWATLETR